MKTDWESDIKVIKPSSKNYSEQIRFSWWDTTVHEFNSVFTNVGKNLASKIPNTSTAFEYL